MTLKYIDEKSLLQRFPVEFVQQLESVGWEEFAKYRSRLFDVNSPHSGDIYAEVRLMRATGSDGVLRQFGLVNAYNLQAPTFPDDRIVTYQSQLANIGVGDGNKKEFEFPGGSALPSTVEVQINGAVLSDNTYTISNDGKKITFNTAPTGVIKATYKLSSRAFEPTNTFGIFLFDQVDMARTIDDEKLKQTTGLTYEFENKNILPASLKVTINGTSIDELDYSLDAKNGTITLGGNFSNSTAPTINAKYAYTIEPVDGHDYGDLRITNVTPSANFNTADDLANLAYRAVRYTRPSLMTLFTLNNGENFEITTNRDAIIKYWGSINRDRLILHFRVDAGHNTDAYYFAPLYLGRIVNNGQKPMQNTVLIGGCRTGKSSPYAANKKLGGILVDNGPDTANGNNHVILHQSIGGMYHQKHYLSFVTHDKTTERENAGQGPSVYDGLYHDSMMFIEHKFDRTIGHLDDVYAIHPMGINQFAELELENTYSNRHFGTGDGVTKVFHLDHHAKEKPIVSVNCVEQDIEYDDDYKTVTFKTAPARGARITASYTAHNMHIFNVTDTEICPMSLDTASPFVGIGWGVFQKKT